MLATMSTVYLLISEGLAGGGRCALLCARLFWSARTSASDNCIHQRGEGAVWSVGEAGRLSHTPYQCRITVFVPNRVNRRLKEKQKASLLSLLVAAHSWTPRTAS